MVAALVVDMLIVVLFPLSAASASVFWLMLAEMLFAPPGEIVMERLTVPVNPATLVIVIWAVPDCP